EKVTRPTEAKDKGTKETKETKETKDKETKGKSNLVGRVKKVIKKSRRKLGEEKFEKELRRTIEFLAQLQTKLGDSHGAGEKGKAPVRVEKKTARKVVAKVEKKATRNSPKKGQSDKKDGKKPAGNGAGKKHKDAQIKDAALEVGSVAAPKVETTSKQ